MKYEKSNIYHRIIHHIAYNILKMYNYRWYIQNRNGGRNIYYNIIYRDNYLLR